jgi:hypothetical protein
LHKKAVAAEALTEAEAVRLHLQVVAEVLLLAAVEVPRVVVAVQRVVVEVLLVGAAETQVEASQFHHHNSRLPLEFLK